MSGAYAEFLESKRPSIEPVGIEVDGVSDVLYPFQQAIVMWACKLGRAAVFADCGLGKTLIQLEWARQLNEQTLIVAPLAVTQQTIDEALMLDMDVTYVTLPSTAQFQITNYERLHNFVGADYGALVLDESSILKSLDGKTRTMILNEFTGIPFRLACTATPAPNDLTELGNHAQYLGVMSYREMSAAFFVKESNSLTWRLKGHASEAFYRWLTTWGMFLRSPSDIGFDDERFTLPELDIVPETITGNYTEPGCLFPGVYSMKRGISGRVAMRRQTETERIGRCVELIQADTDNQWIVWCGLNSEGRNLYKALGADDAELVEGSMGEDEKLDRSRRWLAGESRIMISKPTIYGYGMNFQNCARMAFLGLGDSYEQYYQAIRRCWRYGQSRDVRAFVITTDAERDVTDNIKRKEKQAETLASRLLSHVGDYERAAMQEEKIEDGNGDTGSTEGEMWTMHHGDSCDVVPKIAPESVGFSVFSPPFVSLYTYSATSRDIGNSKNDATFWSHFGYVIDGILSATIPGRLCAVHVSQIPAMLVRDGYIGMKDFRAETVRQFSDRGWIYHGEVVIDKDPQVQAIRTHSKGLLFIQLKKDASWLRPALADYIVVFRKPGDNPTPIKPDISQEQWIEWARPIWYGIKETETLNYREARTNKDERHICPLQLGTIERCIRLWSNPGDLILSPFGGIGSEGWVAVRNRRRYLGVELKKSYYDCAVRNLGAAQQSAKGLFG